MSLRIVAPVTAFVLVAGAVTFTLGGMPGADAGPPVQAPVATFSAADDQVMPVPHAATPSGTATPTSTHPSEVGAPASAPVLDVKITGTMGYSPTMDPPATDGYRGVYHLVDEAHGFYDDPLATTFLFAHARTEWRGHSDGNDWLTLAVADLVTLDGDAARVVEAFTVNKNDLADVEGLWSHVPGRTVLITCVPLASGEPATENRVVILQDAR